MSYSDMSSNATDPDAGEEVFLFSLCNDAFEVESLRLLTNVLKLYHRARVDCVRMCAGCILAHGAST